MENIELAEKTSKRYHFVPSLKKDDELLQIYISDACLGTALHKDESFISFLKNLKRQSDTNTIFKLIDEKVKDMEDDAKRIM